MGYFKDTVKGISWMGILRGSTRLISLIRIVILARVLGPVEFGVFGIASLAVALLEIFTETGVNVFFIQEKAKFEEYLDTAWIISIARGFIISATIFFGAHFISNFFHSPASLHLLIAISIVPLLRGFINPSVIKFQKNLEFGKEFAFRFVIFSVDAVVSILLGVLTHSAISLVYGLLASVVLEMFLSFWLFSSRPKFDLNLNKLKIVTTKGKWVTLAGIFNYFFHNGDDIAIGKLLDTQQLGLYQVAYKISTLPIYEVGEIFGKVTFPIFAKIAADKKRLEAAFLKVTLIITLLVLPYGMILIFFPSQIIKIVLGNAWLGAVPSLRILALFGIFRAITGSVSALFLAVKKQDYIATFTLLSLAGLAITIVPLTLKYGIVGASFSAIIGSLVATPVILYLLNKIFSEKS